MNNEIIAKLSPTDYKIMVLLEGNGMVSRETLLLRLWGEMDSSLDGLLRQAIHRLRIRLHGTRYSIVNVRAIRGYRLEERQLEMDSGASGEERE